jgi:hypothetical protein
VSKVTGEGFERAEWLDRVTLRRMVKKSDVRIIIAG